MPPHPNLLPARGEKERANARSPAPAIAGRDVDRRAAGTRLSFLSRPRFTCPLSTCLCQLFLLPPRLLLLSSVAQLLLPPCRSSARPLSCSKTGIDWC